MTKNEVLKSLIEGLNDQRKRLVVELSDLDPSNMQYLAKETTLNNAIMNIDNQISMRINDLEIGNQHE